MRAVVCEAFGGPEVLAIRDQESEAEASPIAAGSLIHRRRQLAGSLIGGIKETQEMLDFCAKHKVFSDIELIPIHQINGAYERMLKSDVRYRFVIDMKTLGQD